MIASATNETGLMGAEHKPWKITDRDRGQIALLDTGRYPRLVAHYDETEDGLPYVFLEDPDGPVTFSIVPDTKHGSGWALLNARQDVKLSAATITACVLLLLQGSAHAIVPSKQEGKLVLRPN